MARTTVNYHIRRGEHVEVGAQDHHCLVVRFGADEVLDDLVLFADPTVMVELLSAALTQAQDLVDGMNAPYHDASRPGPDTRSPGRSVVGAGVPVAPPALMVKGRK
jgi:hypothetical protein